MCRAPGRRAGDDSHAHVAEVEGVDPHGVPVGDEARTAGRLPEAERREALTAELVRHYGPRAAKPEFYVDGEWSETMQSMNSITSSGPNLDQVRDKIERRYANALGAAELAQNSIEGRMAEVEQAGIQMAGHGRLEQLRAEMAGELTAGDKPAIEKGGATSTGNSNPVGAEVNDDAVAQRMRELRGEA